MDNKFTGYIIRADYDLNNLTQYGFKKTEPAHINPWWQCPFNLSWNVIGTWDCELLVDQRDRRLLMWHEEGCNLEALNNTIAAMKRDDILLITTSCVSSNVYTKRDFKLNLREER